MDLDPELFVTKEACKIHNDQIMRDINNIGSEVSRLQGQNNKQDVAIAEQSKVLEHLTKSIDTLNDILGHLKSQVSTVDKDQAVSSAVNSQASKFNLDLNWKTISAIGIIGMAILNTVLSKI